MTVASSPEVIAAYAHCRAIAKREAKNFYYSFRVLPQHKSDAMCAVYAFMRKADDLADDESLSLAARRQTMAIWTTEWRDSRHTSSDDPVFLAVNDTQQRFDIPDLLLDQLIAGTTLDLQDAQPGVGQAHIAITKTDGEPIEYDFALYDTFDALYRYCYLVASVVGLVCIRIFGYSDPRAEQLAEHTGIAFQLTNILRDVKEDADRGRIYLPSDDMQATGTSVDDIRAACAGKSPGASLFALMQKEISRAQNYYNAAGDLIPLLDADSREAMRVLVTIYHRLLDRIAADPAAVFRNRVSVPTVQKLSILARGLFLSALNRGRL